MPQMGGVKIVAIRIIEYIGNTTEINIHMRQGIFDISLHKKVTFTKKVISYRIPHVL